MAFWVELHCDVRKSGRDPQDVLKSLCWSDRNDGAMAKSRNPRESLLKTVRFIEDEARRMGWKHTKRKWICPGCQITE